MAMTLKRMAGDYFDALENELKDDMHTQFEKVKGFPPFQFIDWMKADYNEFNDALKEFFGDRREKDKDRMKRGDEFIVFESARTYTEYLVRVRKDKEMVKPHRDEEMTRTWKEFVNRLEFNVMQTPGIQACFIHAYIDYHKSMQNVPSEFWTLVIDMKLMTCMQKRPNKKTNDNMNDKMGM